MHYKLESEAETLIAADSANKKYWDDCKTLLKNGKKVCNYKKKILNFTKKFILLIISFIGIFG